MSCFILGVPALNPIFYFSVVYSSTIFSILKTFLSTNFPDHLCLDSRDIKFLTGMRRECDTIFFQKDVCKSCE